MFFEASPEFMARFLTSSATTAKPAPTSPARAAIQCQQIGLEGDGFDRLNDFPGFGTGL